MTSEDCKTTWRKSSYSGQKGECVELGRVPEGRGIRDSKNPSAPLLTVSRSALAALIAGIDRTV